MAIWVPRSTAVTRVRCLLTSVDVINKRHAHLTTSPLEAIAPFRFSFHAFDDRDRSFPPPLIRPRDLNSIARCSYGLERRDRVDRTSTPGVSSDSSDSSRLVRAALTVMSAALTVFLRLTDAGTANGTRGRSSVTVSRVA